MPSLPVFMGLGIWALEETPAGVKLSYVRDVADKRWRSRLVHQVAGDRLHHHFYSPGLERLTLNLEKGR